MIRYIQSDDYLPILSVLNDWWGGRNMADMLPKLFFEHFQDTSFTIEKDGEIAAFLVGFRSQSNHDEAYIHFVGVNPNFRKSGLGKELYLHFFKKVKEMGRVKVRCITSPVNQTSILFHKSMGFTIETTENKENGIYIYKNYDGFSNDRVLFVKEL